MLLQLATMAVGESAIEVLYKGKKAYAAVVIDADGGAGASPLISLGVSDTSLVQAVTNKVTAFTGASDSLVKHIVAAIKNASGGTVDGDDEITMGDWDCRVKDDWEAKSCYHATLPEYTDAAGSVQFKGAGWTGTLIRDNDADTVGRICKRVPPPAISQDGVGIRTITGMMSSSATIEAAITNGITRNIRDDDGNVLWHISDASPTNAELKFDLGDIVIWPFPVIVEEVLINQATNYAECIGSTTAILWGLRGNNMSNR